MSVAYHLQAYGTHDNLSWLSAQQEETKLHDLSIKQLSNSSQLVCFRQSWTVVKAFMQLQGLRMELM